MIKTDAFILFLFVIWVFAYPLLNIDNNKYVEKFAKTYILGIILFIMLLLFL